MENYLEGEYDQDRALSDPPYALAWAKKFYQDEINKLQNLVNDHVTNNYIGASSFVDMLAAQTIVITEKLKTVQYFITEVSKLNNSDWL